MTVMIPSHETIREYATALKEQALKTHNIDWKLLRMSVEKYVDGGCISTLISHLRSYYY